MGEFKLQPVSALGGYNQSFEGTRIAEIETLSLVSLAAPRDREDRLTERLRTVFGAVYPSIGTSATSDLLDARFAAIKRDELLVMFTSDSVDPVAAMKNHLGEAAYITDQTDVWSTLQISGPGCRDALERICPLDLHPEIFLKNHVARTMMEHLGVIIVRNDEDAYVLLSARSSAQSFLHTVETSIRNVL